jgi:hypothetical protein
MTKITLENRDGKYTVEVSDELVTISDVIDDLIRPVLLAAGFHNDTIDEYLGEK